LEEAGGGVAPGLLFEGDQKLTLPSGSETFSEAFSFFSGLLFPVFNLPCRATFVSGSFTLARVARELAMKPR
jgi:hypothetical protein